MFKIKLKSNWETVAFALIRKLIYPNISQNFSRSQLMSTANINDAVKLLELLGHKKHQEYPKDTLQRTIQNMRDKGYIIFHGDGIYSLTEEGKKVVSEIISETT